MHQSVRDTEPFLHGAHCVKKILPDAPVGVEKHTLQYSTSAHFKQIIHYHVYYILLSLNLLPYVARVSFHVCVSD